MKTLLVFGLCRVPVAAIQMPPAPWERNFYEELLIGLGTVLPAGMSSTAPRHRSCTAARQLEVQMVIIDEIHSTLAGTFPSVSVSARVTADNSPAALTAMAENANARLRLARIGRNQAPTIPFNVSAFRTAFPPPSLLKYTNTSRPMPCHSRTRSAHQRRSSWL